MSDEKDIYDLTIIGGGPVGLFAAFYAGIRKAKTKIIDSLPQLGGQLTMLYPEKYIYDIPGFPAIKAGELIANLEKQMQPFQHDVCLEEEVTHLAQEADGLLRLDTTKGTHYSKTVIFAIGNGAFQPRRLAIENVEGESIHYYVTDMKKFAGKKVAIAGGGDSAIDWALMLENVAEEVSIIHRRPQFRGHEHSVEQLEKSSVSIRTPYIISDILKENETFTGIQLTETKGDQTLDLPVGDICSYEGKVKLIATGFGEAPTAVNNALHYLRPDARRQPVHSTSLFENGVPK